MQVSEGGKQKDIPSFPLPPLLLFIFLRSDYTSGKKWRRAHKRLHSPQKQVLEVDRSESEVLVVGRVGCVVRQIASQIQPENRWDYRHAD